MIARTKIAIGLGSNLGDRRTMIERAVGRLREDVVEDLVASSIYESPPWGYADQPAFLNAVVTGICEWEPPAVVSYLRGLEALLGRTPSFPNGPREIDLDLLAWGEKRWATDGVSVPHPRMGDRDFVLLPLAEIWPDWVHPGLGKTVAQLSAALPADSPARARRVGSLGETPAP